MGFAEVWKLYDESDSQFKARIDRFIAAEALTDASPWMVIDFSNVVFSVYKNAGGHRKLFEKYAEAFWRAVFYSNFKILIVKDGFHCGERAVIKLQRMLKSIRTVDPAREDPFNDLGLFFSCEGIMDRVRNEASSASAGRLIVDTILAPGEADDEIKKFCKSQPGHVIILSNDTSLILGQDERKFIVSMSRLVLKEKPGGSVPLLFGPALQLGSACLALLKATIAALKRVNMSGPLMSFLTPGSSSAPPIPPINADTILLIACLMENEYSDVDPRDAAHSPYHILNFIKNFVFPYNDVIRSKDRNRKLSDLIIGAITVLTFAKFRADQGKAVNLFEGFEEFLVGMKAVATGVIERTPEGQAMHSLKRSNAEYFPNVCRSLLESLEDVDGIVGVLRRRLPSGVAGEVVEDPFVLYSAEWGVWASAGEPVLEGYNTQDILHPVHSVLRQITAIQRAFPSAKTTEAAASAADGVVIPPADPALSVLSFNEWLKEAVSQSPEVRDATTSRSRAQYWSSRQAAQCPDDRTPTTRGELFQQVLDSSGLLPSKGYLVEPAPTLPSGASSASTRPGVSWDVAAVDVPLIPGFSLFGSSNPSVLTLCEELPLTVWSVDEAVGPAYNLHLRSQLLAAIINGNLVVGGSGASRLNNTTINIIFSVDGNVEVLSKLISKLWKSKFSTSFADAEELKVGSLGAAFVLSTFARSFGPSGFLPPRVLECLIDAILLSPLFSALSAKCSVLGDMRTNLRDLHASVTDTLPEKLRVITRQSFRWIETLHFLLKDLLGITTDTVTDSDLSSWFDSFGMALVLQLGLKAATTVHPDQCAALWVEPLLARLGLADTDLESLVSAVSKARSGLLGVLRS